MSRPNLLPTERPAWARLTTLARGGVPHLRDLLSAADAPRAASLQMAAAGLRLDATRQAITPEVWQALLDLAAQSDVHGQAMAQRRGEPINRTEGRAVLHAALRWPDASGDPAPWGEDTARAVRAERDRFLAAADQIREGRWTGSGGEAVTDVVNLGIGGSDLGPRMAVEALDAYAGAGVRVWFVSNPDAWALHSVLRRLDPKRTLFVVQSKTFTTQETMTLAASARRWLAEAGIEGEAAQAHLVGVTSSPDVAVRAGFARDKLFLFWDWVGGRYSVWSAIGLPLAIAIGSLRFREFLDGAHAMDQHFWSTPPARNMPLALALIGVWNRNFQACPTLLMATYASRMFHFSRFIQQMDMESNGKGVHVDGRPAAVDTGPVIWGGPGIDGQHAYFQLVHQGQHRIPVDFIGVESEDSPLPLAAEHHRVTLLNLRAQAEALALGRDVNATLQELRASGLDPTRAYELAPHRSFRGNVPSNVIWLPALTPHALGALVALYEHKVFCQAAIWGIHSYDQWGVELGKSMAREMERAAGL